LACNTLLELKSVLDSVVMAANFIHCKAMNSQLFKAFCDELGKEHGYLVFHTDVWWLLWGKVLSHVAGLVIKVAMLLIEHRSVELVVALFDGDGPCELKFFLCGNGRHLQPSEWTQSFSAREEQTIDQGCRGFSL